MTSAEIIEMQRAAKAHREAFPLMFAEAKGLIMDFDGSDMVDGGPPRDGLTVGHVRTLIREIERLQKQVASHAEDQREAARDARDAYQQGRWDGRYEESKRIAHY